MADTGAFQFNDIKLYIPPQSIRIKRSSHNEFHNTLRTKSSMKTRSGYSDVQIQVDCVFTDTKKELFSNGLGQLQDIVTQVRLTPFVWVENQKIRDTMLNGMKNQAMVLALKHIQIQKSNNPTEVNVVNVTFIFAWFNYSPYMKDWVYREDLMVPKGVRNPEHSKAWRIFYRAEQARKVGQINGTGGVDRYRSVDKLDGRFSLSYNQYRTVKTENYVQVKRDIAEAKLLYQALENYSPPSPQPLKEQDAQSVRGGGGEFSSIDTFVRTKLVDRMGIEGGLSLHGKIFSHTTSMGSEISQHGLNEALQAISSFVIRSEKEWEATTRLLTKSEWKPVRLKDNGPVHILGRLDITVDDVDKLSEIPKSVLMEKPLNMDFSQFGIVITGISISFQNVLATIPLLGHPYPTFQHIGSIDGVVTLSMRTTNEDSVRALSAFYNIQEIQENKFRMIPQGQKNIRIRNDLINMCGLREFICEDFAVQTVPGEPGTTDMQMTLVENPITSATRESINPGQGFTTHHHLRIKIMEILASKLQFNPSLLNNQGASSRHNTSAYSITGGGETDRDKLWQSLLDEASAEFTRAVLALTRFYQLNREAYESSQRGEQKIKETQAAAPTFRRQEAIAGVRSAFKQSLVTWEQSLIGILKLSSFNILGVEKVRKDFIDYVTNIGKPEDRHAMAVDISGTTKTYENSSKVRETFEGFNALQKEVGNDFLEFSRKIQSATFNKDNPVSRETLRTIINASGLTDFHNWAMDFCDRIVEKGLYYSLKQLKPVLELYKQSVSVTSGICYPDFPFHELYKILTREGGSAWYRDIVRQLEAQTAETGLLTKNVGVQALLNPDFYLLGPTDVFASNIIGEEVMNAARIAITKSHGDERLKAEGGWMWGEWKRALGDEQFAKVQELRDKHAASLTAWQKLKALKGDKDLQAFERRMKAPQAVTPESNLPAFYPDDFDGEEGSGHLKEVPSTLQGLKSVDLYSEQSDEWGRVVNMRDSNSVNSTGLPVSCPHKLGLNDVLGMKSPGSDQPRPLASTNASFPDKYPPPDENSTPGTFIWPTSPGEESSYVSSHFGVIRGSLSSKPHNGIDIVHISRDSAQTREMYAVAAADGYISHVTTDFVVKDRKFKSSNAIVAKKNWETTLKITVRHYGGFQSNYVHLRWDSEVYQYWVKVFQGIDPRVKDAIVPLSEEEKKELLKVKAGDRLGLLGSTGYSTAPHLHFSIKRILGGKWVPIPPFEYLNVENPKRFRIPAATLDPTNENIFQKSVEQFEKDMSTNQGPSLMRAYPTFKLYFIESDRGERKRHGFDDFFSYSSVKDITMIRSRKNPADLLVIQLTNISGVLSNRKFQGDPRESLARNKEGRIQAEKYSREFDTAVNTKGENPIASLMLQPGIQIQLRLGYSNNPEELERLFNGVITDVRFTENDDLVEIVCQSYGIQLVQKLYGVTDDVQFGGFFSNEGRTDKLLESMMASSELTHFGRWQGGEPDTFSERLNDRWSFYPTPEDDNVFAPTASTGILGVFNSTSKYIMHRTTIWDVFQEMTLRHPGYVAYPVPYEGRWGPRMTMFFGIPNQLYHARDPSLSEKGEAEQVRKLAHDAHESTRSPSDVKREALAQAFSDEYLQDLRDKGLDTSEVPGKDLITLKDQKALKNAELREEFTRKYLIGYAKDKGIIRTFRNYHLLTTSTNIIQNNINSSRYDAFNMVTLQYSDDSPERNEEVGTLEFEDPKAFTLKCDAGLPDEEQREMFAQYPNCVGFEMAKRYSLGLLMNSLKEGYQGNVVIMGNPRIKPHDVCYIFDEYSDMFGPVGVEQVVHKFSQRTGFITEITPDMCMQVNEGTTMGASDAMGLMAEHYMRRTTGSLLTNGVRQGIAGQALQGAVTSAAVVAGAGIIAGLTAPLLLGAVAGIASLAFTPFAAAMFNSSEHSVGVAGSYSPFGLVGTFIAQKILTSTQMAHPFRYAPLVLHGKPMLGGLPSRLVDNSFVQGIGRWFKQVDKSLPMYFDDMYDRIMPSNWNTWIPRAEGNFGRDVIRGRQR